jgi:hypothetical protein
MSYRNSRNRHDAWAEYRDDCVARYESAGVPAELLSTEQRFTDFLTTGSDSVTDFSLDRLSREQYWQLFQLVTAAFDMQASTFMEFEKRRLCDGWHGLDGTPA